MISKLSHLLGPATPGKALGTSAFVHAAVLTVLAGLGTGMLIEGRRDGRHAEVVIELTLATSSSPAIEEMSTEPLVLVTPHHARIAEREYERAAVRFTRPEIDRVLKHAAEEFFLTAASESLQKPNRQYQPGPSPVQVDATSTATRKHQAASLSPVYDAPYDPHGTLPDFSNSPPPIYPEAARLVGIEGRVVLRLQVDATGRVVSVEIVRGSGYPILDAAAVTQVRRWQGRPAVRFGRPEASVVQLPVDFRLP